MDPQLMRIDVDFSCLGLSHNSPMCHTDVNLFSPRENALLQSKLSHCVDKSVWSVE